MAKGKFSPAKQGMELCKIWTDSISAKKPHGDDKALQRLVNFRIHHGATWNALGCGEKAKQLSDAVEHYDISLKIKKELPKEETQLV
jgi:hypothetical protein